MFPKMSAWNIQVLRKSIEMVEKTIYNEMVG